MTESESEPEDNVASRVDRIRGAMMSSSSLSRISATANSSAPQLSRVNTLDWLFEVGATTAPLGGVSAAGGAKNNIQQEPQPVVQPPMEPKPSKSAIQMERKQQELKREQFKNAFFEKMKHRKAHDLVQVRPGDPPCSFFLPPFFFLAHR